MKKILSIALVLALVLSAACALAAEWRRDPAEVGDTITVYTTMDDGQQAAIEEVWYSA